MPRQVDRGGNKGRQSAAGDQYKAINESIKSCDNVLESVSRVLMESTAYFNEQNIKELSNDIMFLANTNVQTNHTVAYAKRNLDAMEPTADMPAKDIVKKMKSDIIELSKTDTANSDFVKKIGKILQVTGQEDEDEDMVMLEAKDTEAHFMCPYTQQRIEVPMKNQSCSHTISQQGLTALLISNSPAICPVPGCVAKWTKVTSSVDTDFEKKMRRFFRVQEETGGDHASHHVTELHDDDEAEYTQI